MFFNVFKNFLNVFNLKKRLSKFENSTENVKKNFKSHINQLIGYIGGSLLT